MRLKEALSVMSMASPYAVSTERSEDKTNLQQQIKDYLYIEMPIEYAVAKRISSFGATDKKLLFLCGSSGDGKSELLTKAKSKFGSRIKFHLDATHSFDPKGSAIQTLDKIFEEFESGTSPLVVGINAGMMGNYAEEGKSTRIQSAIASYLENKTFESDDIYFINFEDYPKFFIHEDGYDSEFTKKLLERATQQEDNLIRQLFESEIKEYKSAKIKRYYANYQLLSLSSVQQVVIDLLFKARLVRDQFLTARALLDFVHDLIFGNGYLFDNLFGGGENELLNKIEEFDPSNLRTKEIDRFILARDLGLPDTEFEEFNNTLLNNDISQLDHAVQYLRLFYVLKYEEYGNNYHKQFLGDFSESLIDSYINIYQLHNKYTGASEQKTQLKAFYRNTLISAIRLYINRNAPGLGSKHYLLSESGGYQIAAPADLTADLAAVQQNQHKNSAFFNARLKLNEHRFVLPININLLSLLININKGYRPNKHDKNSVILLDELASEIIQEAKSAEELVIIGVGQKFQLIKEDDDISVEEV